MSFLPGFLDDVCISYSSIDDGKLSIHKMGWVDHLYIDLKICLDKHLAQESAIWRDKVSLEGNAIVRESLERSFRSSATLVPVIAPRYFTSEWCQLEYKAFQSGAQLAGGLKIDAKSRIFKVVKQPVEDQDMPPELLEVRPYIFYKIDPVTRKHRDFDPELDPESQYAYACKVDDLAFDIAKFLKSLKSERVQRMPRATVYLALTTSDLQEARESIQRELKSRDFVVLPDGDLRVNDPHFRDKVLHLLPQCAASIHMVGETYGEIAKGESTSQCEVQAALAAEHCSIDPTFRRVIWMPPQVQSDSPLQQKFIQSLRGDSTAQKQTPILEKELNELKQFMLDLFPLRAVAAPVPPLGRLRMYVMAASEDVNSDGVVALVDHLFSRGFDVKISVQAKDAQSTQLLHEKNLKRSGALLIYYGNEDELWLDERLAECIKSGQPTVAYLAGPETVAKRLFRSHDVLVVRNFGVFQPAPLTDFLDSLVKKGL